MSVKLTSEEQQLIDVLTTKGRRSTYTGTLMELAKRTDTTVDRVKILLHGLSRMGLINVEKTHVGSVSHFVITVSYAEAKTRRELNEIARKIDEADRKRESENSPWTKMVDDGVGKNTLEKRVKELEECVKHLHASEQRHEHEINNLVTAMEDARRSLVLLAFKK